MAFRNQPCPLVHFSVFQRFNSSKLPGAEIRASSARKMADIISYLWQGHALIDGPRRRRSQFQSTGCWIDKIAFEAAREIITKLRCPTFEPDFAMHQIVRDVCLRRAGANPDATHPISLW